LNLLGDLDEKPYALTLVGTLDEYSALVTKNFDITVTITETVCDCELLLWNNPASVTDLTVMVGIDAGDISIPMPVPDTATNALNPQFEKCYHNSGTCDEHGQIASISDILINDVPLTSGWIDFTPVGEEPVASSTAVLTIVPTKDNISATTYEIKVAYTTKYGPDITYTAINLSIQCAVTSFTASSNSLPALPYEVFAEAAVFEIATDYFI